MKFYRELVRSSLGAGVKRHIKCDCNGLPECDLPCHIICDWLKFQPKSVLLQKLAIFALLRWSKKPMLLIHQPRWRALLLAEAEIPFGQSHRPCM